MNLMGVFIGVCSLEFLVFHTTTMMMVAQVPNASH